MSMNIAMMNIFLYSWEISSLQFLRLKISQWTLIYLMRTLNGQRTFRNFLCDWTTFLFEMATSLLVPSVFWWSFLAKRPVSWTCRTTHVGTSTSSGSEVVKIEYENFKSFEDLLKLTFKFFLFVWMVLLYISKAQIKVFSAFLFDLFIMVLRSLILYFFF